MKIVKASLGDKPNANIYIFSDMHIGSAKFNADLVTSQIQRCLNDPEGYAILLGDMINNSTKTSVGDTYSESLTPMEQMQVAIGLFEPLKDKIIGITTGNHERRSYKTDGIDLMWFLAKQLGLEDKYDYTAVCLFIAIGSYKNRVPYKYSLYMTHGDGNGGRTVGSKATGLQRRAEVIDADIIVAGHTHTPITFRTARFMCDRQHDRVYKRDQVFVNAAATLKYEEYAELCGMAPSSTTMPVIHLSGVANKIEVTI